MRPGSRWETNNQQTGACMLQDAWEYISLVPLQAHIMNGPGYEAREYMYYRFSVVPWLSLAGNSLVHRPCRRVQGGHETELKESGNEA